MITTDFDGTVTCIESSQPAALELSAANAPPGGLTGQVDASAELAVALVGFVLSLLKGTWEQGAIHLVDGDPGIVGLGQHRLDVAELFLGRPLVDTRIMTLPPYPDRVIGTIEEQRS